MASVLVGIGVVTGIVYDKLFCMKGSNKKSFEEKYTFVFSIALLL